MAKKVSLMAGVVFLFAGAAQAESPTVPEYVDDPGYVNGGHFDGWTNRQQEAEPKANQNEAAAPASIQDKAVLAANTAKNDALQELHPDARPVYNDGGHWGR